MITSNIACPMADCPKKDECARHRFYLTAMAESESLIILNTTRLHPGLEGCEHFIVPRQQRLAYGFRRLADSVPSGNARKMNLAAYFSSESTYFRTKRGERPILPAMQASILQSIEEAGGNAAVGFDSYQDTIIYVHP